MALPLQGLRVVDLSRHLPGPYVTAALVDLGARVVKIEDRETGDPVRFTRPATPDRSDSALHAWLNRGKKSVALDLKSKDGRDVLKALAKKSDILIESFRPGVMHRLGLDYPRLRRVAPSLIYVSLSGYGAHGPMARHATHDLNVVGQTGMLAGARPPAPLVADTAAGLLTLVAILARLRAGERGLKRGGYIDLSILDGALAMISTPILNNLAAPSLPNDELEGTHACYRTYVCRDGRLLAIAALEPQFWRAVCESLGFPGHAKHQWSRSRQPGIIADLERVLRTKTQAKWMTDLGSLNVCVTPVQSVREAMADPQVATRNAFVEQRTKEGAFASPAFLPQLTGTKPRRRAPRHGEHTAEVLASLGYSKKRVLDLRNAGAIR